MGNMQTLIQCRIVPTGLAGDAGSLHSQDTLLQALLNKNFDHMPHLFLLQYLTEQAEGDAANPPRCLVDNTTNEMILRLLRP